MSPEIKYMLSSLADNNNATYNSPDDNSPDNNVLKIFSTPRLVQCDNGMEIPNMKGDVNSITCPSAEENFITPSPKAVKQTDSPIVKNVFL